jgi:rod shape-determining protein MreC
MNLESLKDRVFLLVVFIILSIFFLLLDSIGVIGILYDVTALITVPIRLELKSLNKEVNDIFGAIGKMSSLSKENEILREENVSLIEQSSQLEEYKYEIDILKEQLELKEKVQGKLIEARVIGSDVSLESALQLNVGRQDGVEEGDIAIFGKYAVGRVIRSEHDTSKISLITSPSSNIPVRGQTNRAVGLVKGKVGFTLKMIDILPDEKVEEGEIIVTSGVESPFPAGLIIGIVDSVNENPAFATQEADIEAQIDFSRLDYIYIMKGQGI